MEGVSPAHELPDLYRAVLERVGALEQTGHRREAEVIRREAVTAYSRAWDDTARRRLLQLRGRAERALDGQHRGIGEPVASASTPAAPPPAIGSPRPA